MRVAPAFQLWITPVRDLPMMASSDESTIPASQASGLSADRPLFTGQRGRVMVYAVALIPVRENETIVAVETRNQSIRGEANSANLTALIIGTTRASRPDSKTLLTTNVK